MDNQKALELLHLTRVEVAPETFFLLSLSHKDLVELFQNPELSPRLTAPFMIFQDKYEVTLLFDETDFSTIRHTVRDAKIESGFRLLTFDIELEFSVVGFLALISKILSEAEIPIVALSAFSRDHLIIKQDNLAKALKVLGAYVKELC